MNASRRLARPADAVGLVACVLGVGIVVGLTVGPWLTLVSRAGVNLAPHHLHFDYFVAVLWAVVLGVLILAWPVPLGDRLTLLGLWALKSFVALAFMLVYESVFSSLDAFGYFYYSLEPSVDWKSVGWGSGSYNLIAVAWLHGRVLPESFHALKISFAMVGLLATYIFYRAAVTAGAKPDRRLLIVLALTPSILFWSSIVGKDPLILLGVAVYSYGIIRWARGGSAFWLVAVVMGGLLASFFRIWMGPILALPALILAARASRSAVQRLVLLAVAAIALWVGVSMFRQTFLRESTLDIIEATNVYSRAWAHGGSSQQIEIPFTSAGSVLKFLPLGMFTALMRPLPGDVMSGFGLLAGVENAVIFVLFVVAMWRARFRDFRDPLVLWAALLVVLWSAVYGFVSYQNLGTGVRFRLQILPVFLLLLMRLAIKPGATGNTAERYVPSESDRIFSS